MSYGPPLKGKSRFLDHVLGLFSSPSGQKPRNAAVILDPGQATQILNVQGDDPGWGIVLTVDAEYAGGFSPGQDRTPLAEFQVTWGTASAIRRRLKLTSPGSVCLPATSLQVMVANTTNHPAASHFGITAESINASAILTYGTTALPARWIVPRELISPNPAPALVTGIFEIPPLHTIVIYSASSNTGADTNYNVQFGYNQTVSRTRGITVNQGARVNVPVGACSITITALVPTNNPYRILLDGEVIP